MLLSSHNIELIEGNVLVVMSNKKYSVNNKLWLSKPDYKI